MPADTDELGEIITEATDRIASITAESGFVFLSRAAEIFQEIGERVAQIIYERGNHTIVCKKGCAYCCHIPTSVRPSHPTGNTKDIFRMTVLDMITLIDKYPSIKQASSDDISAIILSTLDRARCTTVPQRCPFLNSDDACGIYPYRPTTCKIWFSADVEICRYNFEHKYSKINELTRESNSLRIALEQPFKTAIAKRFPELEFGYYDFLKALAFIAGYDAKGCLAKLAWNFDTDVPGRLIGPLLVPDSTR